jgi:lipid-binding SYLF domain-containing protein
LLSDRAFSDNTINNTIPKGLFEKARGIAIISSIEAGFVFSGNLGTGIVIVKDEDGEWSPPSAIGLTGMGWGLLIGASLKDIVLFLFDDLTVDTLAGDVGLKFGAQGELTVGPFGRAADISVNLSKNGGVGSTFALAHTRGLFAGLSLDGALLGCREGVNQQFYRTRTSPRGILFEGAVEVPEDTWLPEVYERLTWLEKQNSVATISNVTARLGSKAARVGICFR